MTTLIEADVEQAALDWLSGRRVGVERKSNNPSSVCLQGKG